MTAVILESHDRRRCQAFPNMLNWSPFSLGPRPTPVRCSSVPVAVLKERFHGDDGLMGEMSVCGRCLDLFFEHTKHTKSKYKLAPIWENTRA